MVVFINLVSIQVEFIDTSVILSKVVAFKNNSLDPINSDAALNEFGSEILFKNVNPNANNVDPIKSAPFMER